MTQLNKINHILIQEKSYFKLLQKKLEQSELKIFELIRRKDWFENKIDNL